MNGIAAIERQRVSLQDDLDALKTAAQRNRLGQFATPSSLSMEIARYVKKVIGRSRKQVHFLDPAIGTGSFYSAFVQAFPKSRQGRACGVELDHGFAKVAKEIWSEAGLDVIEGDFTKEPVPTNGKRFNLILTNPPYVRHHHLDSDIKRELGREIARRMDIKVSGLAGLYCYFLLLADAWLADDGLSVWLIPSEFMDVNYGKALKTYLTEQVQLRQIHRYCPLDVQFDDALVSSAVVIFEKRRPEPEAKVTFTFGGTLEEPAFSEDVGVAELRSCEKWTRLPERGESLAPSDELEPRLGDLFTVKRGIATGNNAFFIVTKEEAVSMEVPDEFLRPILPSPRHIKQDIIDACEDDYPDLPEQLALIDCCAGEEELKTDHPKFWEYISKGVEEGVNKGYLASRREPWYAQEKRDPPAFLCTYMGRSKERPFRFIWNRSNAIAANVYLLLYAREPLATLLKEEPSLEEKVFAELKKIGPGHFFSEGRVYGGGLHKMEPAELKRIPVGGIASMVGMRRQKSLLGV